MFNTLEANQILDLNQHNDYVLIDLRSTKEFQNDGVAGSIHLPYASLPQNLNRLPSNKKVVFMCNDGNMAGAARNFVKGYARLHNVFALEKGVAALHKTLELQKAG
ncbi:MAG: rhodanese-like domain-containing protein [Bacteroidia bacterium]